MSNRVIETYYLLLKNGTVYVKEGEFFEAQKKQTEETCPKDRWWKAWVPVQASSIEAARVIGFAMHPDSTFSRAACAMAVGDWKADGFK